MATITGNAAGNRLDGTAGADAIRGLSGRDVISGAGGRDTISGGEGGDVIDGGAGDDVIYGFGPSDTTAGSGNILATRVAAGFGGAVFATAAPGNPDRLFVVQKTGGIWILNPETGGRVPTPFLDIPEAQIQSGGEQGLLGLAFHPDYATNGQFFVFVTNSDGDLEIRRYTRSAGDPNRADPDSADVILTIPHPTNSNHNGGWIGFGPDGFLYIATGDGGGGGDPANNAQNVDALLGKILRIDVDGDAFPGDPGRDYRIPDGNPFADGPGADEIWALGLRNPWRPSFDRLTGDFYIADVGQGAREEVNFLPAGSEGGANFGWVVREGTTVYDPSRPGNPAPNSPDLIAPVIDYPHVAGPGGGFSVTGGYVYRGTAPGMQGVYFYADFVSDQIWSFRIVNGRAVDAANRTAQLVEQGGSVDQIASFAEDGRGNLYIIGLDGEIFLLSPRIGAGDGADNIAGGHGNDRIHGGAGNDSLRGGADNDTLHGDGQNDLIVGGAGRDLMFGGAGADTFDFNATAESPATSARDVIGDFGAGRDRIDLSGIDARAGVAGNQAFVFIGDDPFSAQGQVRAVQAGSSVIVTANTAGTTAPELRIVLRDTALADIDAGDFIL